MHLIDLVKRFRKEITIAVGLVILENIAWIIEPTLFGYVIDAVIDKSLDPETSLFTPLIFWILAFVVNSGVGSFRRYIDPRIFLNIFTSIASDVAKTSIQQGLSVSKTAARAELSYQYISFLQYRMPEIIEYFIAISGAVIAMYLIDWRIALTCMFIVLPLFLMSRLYNKKVLSLQRELHDGYEDVFEVFSRRDPEYVKEYYRKLALPQKRIANWGAFNFGVVRVALLIIFLVVLYIAIDLDDFSAGELYAIVAYLWTFVTSTEYLPELMESWTSLKDISRRLKSEDIEGIEEINVE
jgi:ABC-type multidrug transport system fused ATPase/permease subunit